MKIYNWLILLCLILSANLEAQSYTSLRTVLDAQINNSVINLPKSTYLLDLSTKGAYTFSGKKNMTINGNGSTIICNKQKQAFTFSGCENLIFSNFHIEYDPPCSTQGTITSMSDDKKTWQITLHDGYPSDSAYIMNDKAQVYSQNTLELVKNNGDNYAVVLSNFSGKTFNLTVFSVNTPVQIGDYVVLEYGKSSYAAHGIILNGCKSVVMDSIVMYDSNCFSFYETDCERTVYNNCVITRKPYDARYTIQPLRAGVADGIHSKFAKVGPVIQNCRIQYNGDDCIAINGRFYPVYATDSLNRNVSLLSTSTSVSDFKMGVGDTILCVNNDGSIRGKTIVKSVAKASTPSADLITNCYSKLGSTTDQWSAGIVINVSDWISGCDVGDVFYSNNRIGRGFKVLNNQVGHNRSRGILIKSSDGVISGNTVEASAMGAIVLSPEFYWMEAGCPNNVEICYNRIKGCMYGQSNSGNFQAGALSVVALAPNGNNYAPNGCVNSISIHDDTIIGCPRPTVVLSSINGIKMYNNLISGDLTIKRSNGSSLGVKNNVDLWTKNISNLTTGMNEITLKKPENNFRIDKSRNLICNASELNVNMDISIFELSGRKLIEKKTSAQDYISLATLRTGIYILQIVAGKERYSQKLILY